MLNWGTLRLEKERMASAPVFISEMTLCFRVKQGLRFSLLQAEVSTLRSLVFLLDEFMD